MADSSAEREHGRRDLPRVAALPLHEPDAREATATPAVRVPGHGPIPE